MDRNREARRVTMAASNGLSRRRPRSSSLRDSPEDDGPVELHEPARLRDRGMGKKDRDRDTERDHRDRDREKERDRDRMSSRSKRRRGDRIMHGSNREDGGDDSSEESVNDEEYEDDDDGSGVGGGAGGTSMRMLPPNPSSLSSSSMSNHHHRKSFPPPAKVFKTGPATTTTAPTTTAPSSTATPWKAPDEMIGVSVPRKARSASTKRSHECWASSGGGVVGGEQIHRQASTSPVKSSGPSVVAAIFASASPAPVSPPSSSNISVKKKLKTSGPKQRPPKSSTKSTSLSAQDAIEIEIAQVLFGLGRQPQGTTKHEILGNDCIKIESREVSNNINKSTGDTKSRVSSPISNSTSTTTLPHPSSIPSITYSSAIGTPMSAIAPRRKRPRPVKYEEENPSSFPVRNSPISAATKVEIDHPAKVDASLPNLEKNSVENGGISCDLLDNQAAQVSSERQPENNMLSESKPLAEETASKDLDGNKEEPRSPKKEPLCGLRLDGDRDSLTATKENSTVSEMENHREEKFQIDLMAPPPLRSSPERECEIDVVVIDPKPKVQDVAMEMKPVVKDEEKTVKSGKDVNAEHAERKSQVIAEDVESQKPSVNKERNIDLQLDLEKIDRDNAPVTVSGNKLHQHVQKQQQQPNAEKIAQTSSLPLPMSMASWPGGIPHMGYMAPLQGVVPMDGAAVSSASIQPPHLLFNQPRPKRCATHCYIARNILYHQQMSRMGPFWPTPTGSALPYGAKGCNVNVVPSPELHAGRGVNSVQEKGQSVAIFPGHPGKDKSSQAASIVDNAQRKQILLQQALPPGAPSNILHGPAFIFPLSQQQAAAAAVRPGTVKSPPIAGSGASSSSSSSASISATATAVAGATAMSFNYPNMPGNETQYLAILQNGAYPIPIPTHVGATPPYRGTHPPAMPFFNGSFYSSQMLHPSQLHQPQPPPTQSQQSQQSHQNPSISSGSTSSQKNLQNQQQRPHGSGNFQGFPAPKNQPSPSLQLQQRQQAQNQCVPHQARLLESEVGEDSPSTAESRVSRASMSIYGQNFAMPLHPPNFASMAPASLSGASGNPGEKKHQQPQAQGSKSGVEALPSQPFAMSFNPINGTTAPGLDMSSIAQNHTLLQSLPEATRHSYHFMAAAAAAQAAQQKKNYRVPDEGKTGVSDHSNLEEDRKVVAGGKPPTNSVQSITFARPDLTETSVSTMPANTVIDSSVRTLNLGSPPARTSASIMSAAISTANAPSVQQQLPRNQQQHHHQQQVIQPQKQHQFAPAAAASARSKTTATSNGTVYPDHISSSSSMTTKFPNVLPAFPQTLVQSSNSPVQSPQWKNSMRSTTSQIPSPSLASPSPSLKNLPQQQGRAQQTQISFAANPKSTPPPQSNQSPSPPMVVGSPTSSISKSAGGSPRTSSSAGNKGGQSSTLSSQPKNSPSMPAQKSSPVGGRSIPAILGHPHGATLSSSGAKPQLVQQQQQQLPKHALQQAHMLYTSAYMQAQAQNVVNTTNTTSAVSGFYLQRHRGEQQQQPPGSSATLSTGMLSLCPPATLANTSPTDPAKAVAAAAAAAASNVKGGGLPSQGLIHAQFAAPQSSGKPHQLLSTGFPYVHTVPTAVQVKPAEQKQPAGE